MNADYDRRNGHQLRPSHKKSGPSREHRTRARGESRPTTDICKGTVRWFRKDMRYGFITPDDGGKEVFIHLYVVEQASLDTLPHGARLSFERHYDAKKNRYSAKHIVVL